MILKLRKGLLYFIYFLLPFFLVSLVFCLLLSGNLVFEGCVFPLVQMDLFQFYSYCMLLFLFLLFLSVVITCLFLLVWLVCLLSPLTRSCLEVRHRRCYCHFHLFLHLYQVFIPCRLLLLGRLVQMVFRVPFFLLLVVCLRWSLFLYGFLIYFHPYCRYFGVGPMLLDILIG